MDEDESIIVVVEDGAIRLRTRIGTTPIAAIGIYRTTTLTREQAKRIGEILIELSEEDL